ncbi:MAG: ATP-binding protein [Minisyncoccota bacterium]
MRTPSTKKLFTIRQASEFLGVNPGTVRRWAINKMLLGIKVGSRGDWRFKEQELAKLITSPKTKTKHGKFSKLKRLLIENADAIQKSATVHHAKLIGADPLPTDQFKEYTNAYIKIVKAIARNLSDFERGTTIFRKLGQELAKDAVKDGLTIEEAVDGTIFLKQAIWKKLEEAGMLQGISAQDLHSFSQTIGNYCDVLASKTAFTYHNYYSERIAGSEERFRALTEKSADAIALVTRKGKVTYASPGTEGLMGYTPEEFKKLSNPFKLVPPNDRKLITKLFQKLLKAPGSTEHAVYRVLHKNGKHIWIESAMTNLIDDPNVNAVVINYRDITERKHLETQKDDFISIATHELKTPVTSIKAYAQVLQSRFAKEGNLKAVEMLSKMDVQLKKLTGLIGDLLDVTKVEGGKLQFHEGLFDFNELAAEIIDEMKLTTSKHTITKHLVGTTIIQGDRDRIGQVITNLLSNAIKYSPHDEKIIVTTSGNKKEVTLCVQDFGIGIAKDQQDRVFERFFRVGDAEDTFAGMGLGLFISSEIVKRQDGRISVKSTGKKGSSFCFTLPIARNASRKHPTNTLVEDDKGTDVKKKVLIADDNPAILESMTLILEDAGYDVITTVNGQTEQFAQEYLPNVILLDIWMSGQDGRDICKRLKIHKLTRRILIIMISANKDTEKIAKAAGANGFLAKPFDMRDLLKAVATHVSEKYV